GVARKARLELLDELHDSGFSLDELREAVEEGRLPLLPVEQALGGDARYTPKELCEQTGLPLEFIARQRQALGLPRPRPDDRILSEADREALRTLRQRSEAGVPEDSIHATAVG